MNILDIITLIICAGAVIICAWRGFIKIALKLGAVVIAAVTAKFVGPIIGEKLFSDLIDAPDGMGAKLAGIFNSTLSSVIGTVLLFVVLFVVLRIFAGLLSKIITKMTHTTTVDRVLGAVFGLIAAAAFVFLFAEAVQIVATVAAFIDPDTELFTVMEDSFIFKYFL